MNYLGFLFFSALVSYSSFANGLSNSKVVETAYEWLKTNTWDQETKVFYLAGHRNPYLSTASNPVYYWDYWCAGFVGQIAFAANGKEDSVFKGAAPSLDVPPEVRPYNPRRDTPDRIGAKVAFFLMKKDGRIRSDWENMPPGAAIFWLGKLSYGHVAIVTGDTESKGSPLIITTGWPSRPGTRLRSLQSINNDLGNPEGWAALD